MQKKHFINLILLTLAIFFLLAIYGQIEYWKAPYSTIDLAKYYAMAVAAPNIDLTIPQPFVYRILGPYLIGLLPFPLPNTFFIFSIISSITLITLFYFFLIDQGINPQIATTTALLVVFNKYIFGTPLWDYFQVDDILANILILIVLTALSKNNWSIFGLALFLGAITKETVMLMVPVALVYSYQAQQNYPQQKKMVFAIIPAVLLFTGIRWLFPAPGFNLVQSLLLHAQKAFSIETWGRLLINAFIPVSLLPLVFFKSTISFFKSNLHLALLFVLVLVSTFFGSNNERLMAPAFPVVYLLIAVILQAYFSSHIKPLAIVLLSSLSNSFHHEITRINWLTRNQTILISIIALLGTTIVGILQSKKHFKINLPKDITP